MHWWWPDRMFVCVCECAYMCWACMFTCDACVEIMCILILFFRNTFAYVYAHMCICGLQVWVHIYMHMHVHIHMICRHPGIIWSCQTRKHKVHRINVGPAFQRKMTFHFALTTAFIVHQSTQAFQLPDFSWDVVPRFVHCGPDFKPNVPGHPPRLPLAEIYRRMSTFPMATLEKFTLQTAHPANLNEEAKIIEAARAIKSYNTSTRVMFYHMAWQVGLLSPHPPSPSTPLSLDAVSYLPSTLLLPSW